MTADANTPTWLRLALIGAVAGVFASLFGVGGGIVTVPLMVLLLGFDVKVATATSLAAIILTATVGGITHAALDNVAWEYSLLVGGPAVLGLLLGLWIKGRISSISLSLAFAGLLVAVAMWLIIKPAESTDSSPALDILAGFEVGGLGVIAGVLAGLFGVGGGILFVPALTLIVGLPHLLAEGASLVAIIPVSLLGSWRQHRAGTVDWRAAITIGLASVGTAVGGAFLAEATPPRVLQVLFAALMVATATQIGIRAWRAPRRGAASPSS
jgi:uncharacterized membrane protein YfcA